MCVLVCSPLKKLGLSGLVGFEVTFLVTSCCSSFLVPVCRCRWTRLCTQLEASVQLFLCILLLMNRPSGLGSEMPTAVTAGLCPVNPVK